MIDYMRILRQTPHDGGSWWAIAFGATVGLVLMVMQLVYRPSAPDQIAARRDPDLPEGVTLVPGEFLLLSVLFVFGVALVSLTYGIGMAVTDMSES